MLSVYPAILHKEEDGCWVEFPDLAGCHTNGLTVQEALTMAQEALGLYLTSLMENGQEIPEPSNFEDVDAGDGIRTYVSADLNVYRRDTKAVKKMLSIPAWLAKAAEENNISLSKVLQEALKEKLSLG